MDFSKIERLLDPSCFKKREDTGGFEQPQLWRRYGHGAVSPIGNGRSRKNVVFLADEYCPGTRDVFESVLWTLMRRKYKSFDQLVIDLESKSFKHTKLNCITFNKISTLSMKDLKHIATLPTIDVLAIFLARLETEKNPINQSNIVALTTWWLNHSVVHVGAFKSVAHIMLPALEAFQPLLGNLKPFIKITHILPQHQHSKMAFESVYFDQNFRNMNGFQIVKI